MSDKVTITRDDDSTQSYPVVTNQQVVIEPNTSPAATMIYHDPITRTSEEGLAILDRPDLSRCDSDWWDGMVEFVDEPGHYYRRKVYRK